ncbi:DUF2141 domain-containing protein [Sphingomonas sp. SUN019]|uniref:DUF2141 domain-containing protein n=1 Tax=Sphingomonas sp. SUN019 TaxID=2937788 RepID=UPI0021646272|nr:DUF2141 domain-containing protein [Sphingomonas sp. SUN019]UVO49626.1 DUF2141 domain-containing protein [Sphingomonas sp. SUN019]
MTIRLAILSSAVLLASAAPAGAQILGPHAARCAPGAGPAVLATVTGLKNRNGTIRLRLFGGSTSTWFDKKKYLVRIEVPTPASGPIRICLPAPAPGTYAVDLRHDANNNNDTDRADGGGASGDPQVSLWDIILGRKPSPKITGFHVGQGVTNVTITTMYVSGTKLRPASAR